MEFSISWPSSEEFGELVALVRANHAEVTAELTRLGVTMANATDVLNEVAAALRGPLATSVLDLIRERDEAEAARVAAVNALAEEQGREAAEEATESEAAADLRDAFDEVSGLFADDELPDVEPLPPVEPIEEPEVPEPVVDEEPAPVEEPEVPAVDEPAPAEEPTVPDTDEGTLPADEEPVSDETLPADEPAVDDGSGAIEPDAPASQDGAAPTDDPAANPGEEAADDAPAADGAAETPDVAPNPGETG